MYQEWYQEPGSEGRTHKGVHFSGLLIYCWRVPVKEEIVLACDGAIMEGSVECYWSINRKEGGRRWLTLKRRW